MASFQRGVSLSPVTISQTILAIYGITVKKIHFLSGALLNILDVTSKGFQGSTARNIEDLQVSSY